MTATGANLSLLAARVLMALMFVVSAADKFRHDRNETQQIASLHLPAPGFLLTLLGSFEMLAVIAFVFGIYARVFAMALFLFVGIASVLFVNFWSFKGPAQARATMRNIFFGNVAVMGGLLYIAVIGSGAYALIDVKTITSFSEGQ